MPGLVQGKPMPGVGLSLEVLDQQCDPGLVQGKPMLLSRTVPGSPGSAMCLD